MKVHLVLAVLAFGALTAGIASADTNIALNAPVSIVSGGLPYGGTPSLITDGVFAPETTVWSDSTYSVSWSGAGSGSLVEGVTPTGLVLEIDLGADYLVTGAIVQADDNDEYLLQYLDENAGTWDTLYDVAQIPSSGLVTRPNADQQTYASVGPVQTDAVRISAVQGDGLYAVSEVELEGTPVATPEPGSLFLLGSGLVGFAGMLRRRVAAGFRA